MIFTPTTLSGNFIITCEPMQDDRGWFTRTFCKETFTKKIGHTKEWLQTNHSFTNTVGTIRGLHYQLTPFSEIKLVRCIAGAVYDVAVDLRKNSTTYLQYFATELSSTNMQMMYIPEGFAHGFQTLQPNSELIYYHTENYNAAADAGIKYNDDKINIQWPLPLAQISNRDNNHPLIDHNFKAL